MRRVAVLTLLVAGTALPVPALAAGPMLFSYQGQITDAGGAPIAVPTVARFTILWGGTSTENPSTGKPVYQENVVLTPDAGGIFNHLIGAGTPTNQCDEDRNGTATEPCVLAPNDLPNTGTIVFLEMRIDPAGVNNLLSPRQQLVNAPYAMNAATIEGLAPADIVTNVTAGAGLAGGGTGSGVTLSVAAAGVTQAMLATDSVGVSQIAADAVGAAEIATGAVGAAEIATDAVGVAEIAVSAVGSAEIIDGSILGSDIASGAITALHIATDAVGSVEIAAGAVGNSEIADNAINAAKIAIGAVGSAEIGPGAVMAGNIAANQISGGHIVDGSITKVDMSLTAGFSADYTTTSTTETSINLGSGHTFCALAKVMSRFVANLSTFHWCRIYYADPSWFIGVRSNGTTEVTCQAVCF